MKVPINGIEQENNRVIINLMADELNADWISSVRLLDENKEEKFNELDGKDVYFEIEEE